MCFIHNKEDKFKKRKNLVKPPFKPTVLQHAVVGFDGSQWVQNRSGAESAIAYQL